MRPIRRSPRSSTGRTTPTRSACCCRASRRSGICVATAWRCWAIQTIAPDSADRASPIPTLRAWSTAADRRRVLRTGAQAHRRPDRRRVPAERRPEARRPVLHVGPGCDQLQPQLPALGRARRSTFGDGPGAGSGLRRPEQHARPANFSPSRMRCPADARDCTESTTRSRARTRRRSRTTAVSRPSTGQRALEISGQIGTSEGHGETPTQDVAETHPARNSGASWQLNGLGSAPELQLRHGQHLDAGPERHAGRLRLDLRRPARGRRGRGELGEDRCGLRHRPRRVDGPAVRRALQRAQPRVAHTTSNQGACSASPSDGPGELSAGVPELSVRLQHLRRLVPDGLLVLVAVAACGLQRRRAS